MLPLAAAATIIAACPVERAHYRLRADPTVTVAFHAIPAAPDWPSGLALALRFGRTGHVSWWVPWNGGTDDRQNLASARLRGAADGGRRGERPLGDMEFYALDATYAFRGAVPTAGQGAPAHLLLPDLRGFWHRTRDAAPRAFFDLDGCAPPGRPTPPVELPDAG